MTNQAHQVRQSPLDERRKWSSSMHAQEAQYLVSLVRAGDADNEEIDMVEAIVHGLCAVAKSIRESAELLARAR